MEYIRKQQLIEEFKVATKDDFFKPFYDKTYGNKYAGSLTYLHYVFYSFLRGKDGSETTHNKNAYKFLYRQKQLLSFTNDYSAELKDIRLKSGISPYEKEYSSSIKTIFALLTIVFKSLTMEEATYVMNQYSK